MKAEHRKELQTNALADRMGRFIQRARQGPSRGTVLTVILVLVVIGALAFFLWRRSTVLATDSARWVDFEMGPFPKYADENGRRVSHYAHLIDQAPGTPQARGAAVQLAWSYLYDSGIKSLLAQPEYALDSIKEGKSRYEALLSEVKDDPVLGPEVRYAIAVAEEALAVEDPGTHLDRAAKLYKAVVDDYPTSAHGKQAKARLKQLKDQDQYHRILEFYVDLRREYDQALQRHGGLPLATREILRKIQEQQKKKK
jgi:hypothetical protein